MRDTNPGESMDAEGLPELEERPPGIDVELDQEGMMPPRDHPLAVGDDPAYATTPAEERVPESVAARAARENPDFGAGETGLPPDTGTARSAEEAAVHVRSDADDI